MKLTDQEERMFQSLKRRQQRWPRARYALVALALVNLGFAISGFVKPDPEALPMFLLLGAVAVGILVMRDWQGNAQRAVLLRLLEQRTRSEA